MCFDAYHIAVHECGHAKEPPRSIGWLNCASFPCALRLIATDLGSYNGDVYEWFRARVRPPYGTPAQTIRYPVKGKCWMCREWMEKHAGAEGPVPDMPMEKVVGMAYPVDLEYRGPKDGESWSYEKAADGDWVWVLDGWQGEGEARRTFVHVFPMLGRRWLVDEEL